MNLRDNSKTLLSFIITLIQDNILKSTRLFFSTSDDGATANTASTAGRDETTLTKSKYTVVKLLLDAPHKSTEFRTRNVHTF